MRVFKFGGASVKNAEAVRNVAEVIRHEGAEKLLVVVSAMGKTTNALEDILDAAYRKRYQKRFRELRLFHYDLIAELFSPSSNKVFEAVEKLFHELNAALKQLDANEPFEKNYSKIVSFGERISSTIVAAYLNEVGITTELIFAPDFIRTNEDWQEGQVDWDKSEALLMELKKTFNGKVLLSQGFIGGTAAQEITTLGREGSDFSAAIFAYGLGAESVTIWKDVPGVLSADPKRVKKTKLFPELSYQEAAEMTYYGASVIHPKTIKPLANKKIPLHVRSFVNIDQSGTCIGDFQQHPEPSIIFKTDQSIVRFEAKDLSNINQRTLTRLIETISNLTIKINLMMNTAVSFSICINTVPIKLEKIKEALADEFIITTKDNLELVTLKNYTDAVIAEFYTPETVLLELKTKRNFQFVREG
ncbi:MAG: aspartate kinase [Flammeovirgaceae bacterium]